MSQRRSSVDPKDTHSMEIILSNTKDRDKAPPAAKLGKCCLWSIRNSTSISVLVLSTCGIIATIIGILIVCYTAPKQPVQNCALMFAAMVPDPIDYKYNPRSVAISDFDSNSYLDIAVANSARGSIAVFLAYSNGNFSNQTTLFTGANSIPYMLAVGDFNNDHIMDIVVANFGANNVGIFLGHGNGSFPSQMNISANTSRPLWVIAANLNNDTALDFVTANYGTNSISIYYGYGNGTFTQPFIHSAGYDSHPTAVVAGDFNNDRQMDLVIANYGTNNIAVFLANSNNTFIKPMVFSTGPGSNPCSVAVGDFNSDTMLDIAVANYGNNSVGIFLGIYNGTFASQTTYSIDPASPYFIGIADLNKDTRLDLIVTNKGSHSVAVLLGYSDGTFGQPNLYSSASSSSISVAIYDFNDDNRLDIAVVNDDTNTIGIRFGIDEQGFSNQTTFSTGRHPDFVAVGDLNNDTRLDIVVANSGDNTLSILFGYGDGSFANQTTYPTGSQPWSIAVGDFNEDNQLDIVVTNYNGNTVSLLFGYGNGSFTNQITYPTGFYPSSVAVGDFNKDTKLDIVVTNSDSDDNTVSVLLANDNGFFADQTTYPTGRQPWSVAVGDFNNDTQLDIVVVNLGDSTVSVLLAYNNGSFANQITSASGPSPRSVAVGDFNHDGRLDIVVTNDKFPNGMVNVLFGYGNGSFANQTTYPTGSLPCFVAVGNFNEDTQLDIVVINQLDNTLSVLFGYDNGSFANPTTYQTGSNPYSVAFGDFNKDTRLDFAVVNLDDNNVGVLLHYDPGTLGNETTFGSGGGSILRSVVFDDFNNDGRLDIVIANYGTKDLGILLGYGNGSFESQTTITTSSNSYPYSIALGNFTKDTQRDIAVANYGTNNVNILLKNGKGTFTSQMIYGVNSYFAPFVLVVGDFNNDKLSDIAVAYNGSDNVGILVVYDTGPFTNQTKYPSGSNPRSIAVGDFNNDRQMDIVVTNTGDNTISVLLAYGNGSFANQTTYLVGFAPYSVAVGDFDKDTRLDIVVANNGANSVSILFGYENGSFAAQITYPTDGGPSAVAVEDFNKDDRLDIVVANYDSNTVSLLFGYGNGSFAVQTIYPADGGPASIAVGDFNKDTYLDIVVGNWKDNSVGILFGYGNGSFTNQTKYATGSHPWSVAVGDFNTDGRLDIVVTNNDDNTISILFAYDNDSFANQITYPINSNPYSVAVGDFNEDTWLDIVVTNFDLNGDSVSILLGYGNGAFTNQTTYPSGSAPYSVAVSDFDQDTRPDIVVTNYLENTVGVLFGYANRIVINQTMLITGNGSRPQSLAIGDFNNDSLMDIAVANSGSNNVGIFLGYGNFSFTNEMTYSTGASSRPYSIALGDFNNDILLDIVVANYDTNTIGILLGYRNGLFSSQQTFTASFGSRPSSVAVGDFDNDNSLDIIVTYYNTNNVGIFLGDSSGMFGEVKMFSIGYGSSPFSVIVADFNNDSKLDFAVANSGNDNLEIFLQIC